MGVTGSRQSQFARRRGIQQPRRQNAAIDDRQFLDRDAFGIERLRPQSAHPQRIVDNANAAVEKLFAETILEEACLARNRRAVRRSHQMADQRPGNARIEHHRHFARRNFTRIRPCDSPLSGATADAGW